MQKEQSEQQAKALVEQYAQQLKLQQQNTIFAEKIKSYKMFVAKLSEASTFTNTNQFTNNKRDLFELLIECFLYVPQNILEEVLRHTELISTEKNLQILKAESAKLTRVFKQDISIDF